MNRSTLLLRQVNPSFVQNGRVTSQVFRPTPKDQQQLSVYDGDLTDAPAAYQHYTESLELASDGVLAVTVDECSQLDLPARNDPKPDFQAHAVIDFSDFGKSQAEKKAKSLRRKAESRDWLYRGSKQVY